MNKGLWDDLKSELIIKFKSRTRDEWSDIMEGTDICFAPVLSMSEAPKHPHNIERKTFVEENGVMQPNVAPRFSKTPSKIQGPSPNNGEHTEQAFLDWGISDD